MARQAQEKRAEISRQTDADDIRWLMGTKRGRRIVWRLLEQAGVFQLSFSDKAMQMAFNEGRRSFGNQTFAQIQTLCPELYPVMAAEQNE